MAIQIDYDALKSAGYRIFQEMITPPFQSPFTEFPKAFMDWGYIIAQDDRATDDYVRSYPNESKRTVQDYYLLADPLAQLNAKRFDQFLYIFAVHRARDNAHLPLAEQPGYKSPDTNEMLPRTGANFTVGVNRRDGVIVMAQSYNHDYTRRKYAPSAPLQPSQYPKLRYSSDIIFGCWEMPEKAFGMKTNSKKIRHIFNWGITNSELDTVIRKIVADVRVSLQRDKIRLPDELKFPGIEIDVESDPGYWLLGTVVGKSISRLLSQHKEQFGHKVTRKVNILQTLHDQAPYSLYWQVVDKKDFAKEKPKSWMAARVPLKRLK